MSKKKVECQVCHKMVKETSKCLCGQWLCSKCTVFDLSHSADYDKYHGHILWDVLKKR